MRRAVLAAVVVVLLGCAASDGPADPVWAKTPCAECRMLLAERRHAAQALLTDGSRLYFDDLGCMAVNLKGKQVAKWWARTEGDAWVDATTARYRRGARTPMDYGFETSSSGDVSFDELRADALARSQR